VLTTHYMDEAARLCDRLVIIDHGRVVREGTPEGLIATEVGREVLEVRVSPGDADALLAAVAGRIRDHQRHDDLLVLFTDDAAAVEHAARASGIAHSRQTARAAGLEDVFLRLTGRVLRD
jgi:lipooligosaccharide transport system ATP-binding protein